MGCVLVCISLQEVVFVTSCWNHKCSNGNGLQTIKFGNQRVWPVCLTDLQIPEFQILTFFLLEIQESLSKMTNAPSAFEILLFLKFCHPKEYIKIQNSTTKQGISMSYLYLLEEISHSRNFRQKFFQTNRRIM